MTTSGTGRLAVLALLALAGCAAPAGQGAVYRTTGSAIYSNAVFAPDRLAGRWAQVAEFAPAGTAPCHAAGIDIVPQGPGRLAITGALCLGGAAQTVRAAATVSGPGRITLLQADPAGVGAEWWVLWVDDGYRTLAIGTPSGQFGFVLNRDANLPADRRRAAAEVLAFNGYDLRRLRPVTAR